MDAYHPATHEDPVHGTSVVIAVAIALVILGVVAAIASRGRKPLLAVKVKPLLTDNERSFFQLLQRALPQHLVCPQVAFSAFITEDRTLTQKARQALRNQFNRKVADFLVCEPDTLRIIVVIELDDRTHTASADAKRDAITQAAGYHTICFQSKQKPTATDIAARIHALSGADAIPSSTSIRNGRPTKMGRTPNSS